MTDHDRMSSLAAWYANGTLSGADRESFESHLASCPSCREELEECRELAADYPAIESPAPHPAHVTRLLDRIARGAEESLPSLTPPGGGLRALFDATPRLVRWLLAAQVAFAVLATALLAGSSRDSDRSFRTLSSATSPVGELRVVFAPEAGELEIRRLLLGTRAGIVAGPTPIGAYAIALDRSQAGASIDDALEILRASPLVRLAEPIGGKRADSD